MDHQTDRLIVIDTETFGLDPVKDFILEIGVKIVDADLEEVIDYFCCPIWDTPTYDNRVVHLGKAAKAGDETAEYVYSMHEKSGLLDEAQEHGFSVEQANQEVKDFLNGHGIQKDEPMVGSSVQFDRQMLAAQFPEIHDLFHYRNIDTSTIKELCRRWNPRVYEKLAVFAPKQEKHRVLPDIDDTIAELKFYYDNFLWTA